MDDFNIKLSAGNSIFNLEANTLLYYGIAGLTIGLGCYIGYQFYQKFFPPAPPAPGEVAGQIVEVIRTDAPRTEDGFYTIAEFVSPSTKLSNKDKFIDQGILEYHPYFSDYIRDIISQQGDKIDTMEGALPLKYILKKLQTDCLKEPMTKSELFRVIESINHHLMDLLVFYQSSPSERTAEDALFMQELVESVLRLFNVF